MEWSDCSIAQGDVNYDGNLNILDIVLTVNYILLDAGFTDMQIALADINLDGVINILDLVTLANIILSSE